MRKPHFPPIEALIDLQRELTSEHGGAAGLRDRGALEASLARPRQLMAYGDASVTVIDLAVAVCFGIIRNHPFVDGNKRAGFCALGLIMGLNNLCLDVSEHEATSTILALAASDLNEGMFRAWVAAHSN
jgi:death-on-curing protein